MTDKSITYSCVPGCSGSQTTGSSASWSQQALLFCQPANYDPANLLWVEGDALDGRRGNGLVHQNLDPGFEDCSRMLLRC